MLAHALVRLTAGSRPTVYVIHPDVSFRSTAQLARRAVVRGHCERPTPGEVLRSARITARQPKTRARARSDPGPTHRTRRWCPAGAVRTPRIPRTPGTRA